MTYLAIIFTSVFLTNIVLSSLVGFPILTKETKMKDIITSGLKTLAIALITVLIVHPVNKYLIEEFVFLQPLLVVLVAANAHLLVNHLAIKLKVQEESTKFDLIAPINAIVVVASLLVLTQGTYLDAIFQTIGLILGYILITLMLYTIKPRLELPGVPKAFKGLPLLLITLGIIGMIFATGLSGLF